MYLHSWTKFADTWIWIHRYIDRSMHIDIDDVDIDDFYIDIQISIDKQTDKKIDNGGGVEQI